VVTVSRRREGRMIVRLITFSLDTPRLRINFSFRLFRFNLRTRAAAALT
jgi:hypothetical protein